MLDFADLMSREAYNRYSQGFDSTAKLYQMPATVGGLKMAAPTTAAPKTAGDGLTWDPTAKKWVGGE